MTWLALDIGGANVKIADGVGFALSRSLALWQSPQQLIETLRALIAESPPADHLAMTMTGELADCFATKTEGVLFILDALERAADHRHTRVYFNNGTLVSIVAARRAPLSAAAANWHALARFAGRFAPSGPALLIDIGSTTCDLVPLADGKPVVTATSDTERLAAGELVYTGAQRSPVCALVGSVPYRGRACPVAQEMFATTWDVYLTLGDFSQQPHSNNTADGRPATREAARDRLARMVCADRDSFTAEDAHAAATAVAQAQLAKIGIAAARVIARMPAPPQTVILSGIGEPIARRVVERLNITPAVVSLSEQLGPILSQCAPAHALATIAREAVEG